MTTATAPEPALDWTQAAQLLGHPTTWPEHWHTIHTQHGTVALLRTATAEWTTQPTTTSQAAA